MHRVLIEIAVLHHERMLIVDGNVSGCDESFCDALRASMRSLVAPLKALGRTGVMVPQTRSLSLVTSDRTVCRNSGKAALYWLPYSPIRACRC
jgi:hypothetical protein